MTTFVDSLFLGTAYVPVFSVGVVGVCWVEFPLCTRLLLQASIWVIYMMYLFC